MGYDGDNQSSGKREAAYTDVRERILRRLISALRFTALAAMGVCCTCCKWSQLLGAFHHVGCHVLLHLLPWPLSATIVAIVGGHIRGLVFMMAVTMTMHIAVECQAPSCPVLSCHGIRECAPAGASLASVSLCACTS
jgi:hypothetical protein